MATTEITEHADPSSDPDTADGIGEAEDVDHDGFGTQDGVADDKAKPQRRRLRGAMVVGLMFVAALGALAGWLGYRYYQARQLSQQRTEFVQIAREGAVDLTTIDWEHADTDVQRILDAATGTFYDDFSKRSGPFIDVVKQVKSKSQGAITMAGLESDQGDRGRVLVAVNVKTTNAGVPESDPRSWRMRIDVQRVGNDVKISNVEFVP